MGFKDRLEQRGTVPAGAIRLVMDGISPAQAFCNNMEIIADFALKHRWPAPVKREPPKVAGDIAPGY